MFVITYTFRSSGPLMRGMETKDVTRIHADGRVDAAQYDHLGTRRGFRKVARARGTVAPEKAARLYDRLMALITAEHDDNILIADADATVTIQTDGVRIDISGGVTNGTDYADGIVSDLIDTIELDWEDVPLKP